MSQPPKIVLRIDQTLKLAAKGDLDAVKQVLADDPAMLNAMSDSHHRTLLWEAANANRMEVVEYLVAMGTDVNTRDKVTGWPPIAYVSCGDKGEHPEKVKMLIEYGADVNAAGPKGLTALHAASKAGFVSVIELLVETSADIDAKTLSKETPLRLAKKSKRIDAQAFLERHGATD